MPFVLRASAFARNVLTLISPGAAATGAATSNAAAKRIAEFRFNLNILQCTWRTVMVKPDECNINGACIAST
jgi:hypothetical protein